MSKADLFYIVDGHSLIHRAFHSPMKAQLSGGECPDCDGIGDLVQYTGDVCETCGGNGREPTKATYLFLQMLGNICSRCHPAYLAICMDGNREKLRRRAFCAEYKAGRGASHPALKCQMRRIRQLIKLLGVAMFEIEGYEADDLIGTLTKKCVSDDVHIRVVSRDKDLGVLLEDPRVLMYDPQDDTHFGPEWIRKKFKIEPSQLTDYLTLVGDSVDGIKGCPGIGPKAAVELLKEGSVNDYLRKNRHAMISKGWQRKFWAACDDGSLALARKLVPLDCNAPIRCKPSQLEFNGLNFKAASPVLRSLGFKEWSK